MFPKMTNSNKYCKKGFYCCIRIPGGGVHNLLRVQACASHMGGFLGRNSLNKSPFVGSFSINMGGLSRNW